jgi:hypothetical protein
VVAVIALPAVLVLARASGLPAARHELTGGGAWLASPTQGLVTLIDGASEQVIGSVRAPGASADDDLSVLPAGSSAYIVNGTRGTVSRVDGGTYEVSAPVRFGSPGSRLAVLAGGPGLYVVDSSRRAASVTDPVSLRVRQRLSLAARPGPSQSIVDDSGRLWVVDSAGGGLSWFAGGKRTRPEVGDAQARLVLVQGRPVLVDLTHPRLGRLADDGTVASWSCLDVPVGDPVELLGSAAGPRVWAVLPATGTLVAAAVGRDDCTLTVDVGRPGDRFGPLVEAAGFVFVPDRTTGRTAVVDTAAGQVVADLDVVKPGNRLELLAKDGLVFYNDLDGDRAGVIRFDGGRWRLGRSLRKYDPAGRGAKLLTPGGSAATPVEPAKPAAGQPSAPPDPGNPAGTGSSPQSTPGAGPFPPGAGPPSRVPPGSGGGIGGPPPPATPPPTTPPPTTPPPTPTTPGTVTLTVAVTGPGTLTATPAGAPAVPCTATCTIPVRPGSTVRFAATPTSDGYLTDWGLPGCLPTASTCDVTVAADQTVTVGFSSLLVLTVTAAGTGTGSVAGTGLTCAGASCTGSYRAGTDVTVTAAADAATSLFAGWSGCPASSGGTCTLTVDKAISLTASFDNPLAPFLGSWNNVNTTSSAFLRSVVLTQLSPTSATLRAPGCGIYCPPAGSTTAVLRNGALAAGFDDTNSVVSTILSITQSAGQLVVHSNVGAPGPLRSGNFTDTMNPA